MFRNYSSGVWWAMIKGAVENKLSRMAPETIKAEA